jgi:hypothetical protein
MFIKLPGETSASVSRVSSSALKVEAALSSGTMICIYQIIQCHIVEDEWLDSCLLLFNPEKQNPKLMG